MVARRRVGASARNLGSVAIGIAAGTLGGLAAGYAASWMYRMALGYVPGSASDVGGYGMYSRDSEYAAKTYEVVRKPSGSDTWAPALSGGQVSDEGQIGYRESGTTDVRGVRSYTGGADGNSAAVYDTVAVEAARARAISESGGVVNPSYKSALNPLIGIVALMMLNGLAITMVAWLVPGLLARPMAGTMFLLCMLALEIDDLQALSARILAPIGGDPLRKGRDSRAYYGGDIDSRNKRLGGRNE